MYLKDSPELVATLVYEKVVVATLVVRFRLADGLGVAGLVLGWRRCLLVLLVLVVRYATLTPPGTLPSRVPA